MGFGQKARLAQQMGIELVKHKLYSFLECYVLNKYITVTGLHLLYYILTNKSLLMLTII